MTGFDVFAILAVLVSALIGYARGAVREVVTLCAFGLAAVAAIAAAGSAARHKLLPAKGHAAVAAVAGLDADAGFVNKHCSISLLEADREGCGWE